MQTCKLCNGTGWLDIRVEPVGGEDGFGPVDQDADPCWVCNPDGSTSDYFDLPDEIREKIPYYYAQAIGGYDAPYGILQGYDGEGNGTHTFVVDRKCIEFFSWQAPSPVVDCPVCLGWGVWSNNGHIYDCIACGGHPVEARQGFDPLHAWWVNWALGHIPLNLFTPRGNQWLNDLEESRRDDPAVGCGLVTAIERIPGMVRIN